ncbi:hypothetical protein AAL_05043 [Moelleriella libera RCEF 2490]|uniref:A-kinase anchor protein 7-like phosphoesterase domain-containing protein n=1 Tax=Moelleriella libera RCEF 2490 TaxID=1081109 RepID=A0A162IIX4_9HYPO|nr:hypothetical protein AAL_05043 [Moelleriella libera RCEF 2490]
MPPARASPTHFLCLPLASAQLSRSMAAFRADVSSGFALPPGAVRPTGTLHLTLGVMNLSQADRLQQALEVLSSLHHQQSQQQQQQDEEDPGSSSSTTTTTRGRMRKRTRVCVLRGLHSMTSASKTSVLYAAPSSDAANDDGDDDGGLHALCEALRRPFRDGGLLLDDHDGDNDRPLLLHATILNTIYVKRQHHQQQHLMSGGGGGGGGGDQHLHQSSSGNASSSRSSSSGRKKKKVPGRRNKLLIDATDLMAKYDGHVWANDVAIDKLAICRMGARKKKKKLEGEGGRTKEEEEDDDEEEEEDEAYEVLAEADI